MVPHPNKKVKFDSPMDAFKKAKGLFGMPIAIATICKKSLGN